MHIIYGLFNPNRTKVYVGETSNYKERMRHHIYYGSRGWEKEKFINSPNLEKNGLYSEMRSLGTEKFIFVALGECEYKDRLVKEKYWIGILANRYMLYNVAAFGGALYGEQNGNFGLEFTEERRRKISEKAKERLSIPGDNPRARKVIAIQGGKIIKEFDTVSATYGWKGFTKRRTYNSLQTNKEYEGIKIEYKE